MQDRFKFRYVFAKDFGGKIGICYKMPIFNLDTITDENFNKIVKSYIDYDYKLISIKQSSGLKDKYGKLIYEGDILKNTKTNKCLTVAWHNTKAGYVWSNTVPDTYLSEFGALFRVFDKYEVIGNIYENPELLSEVK